MKSAVWKHAAILSTLPSVQSGDERYTEPYVDGDNAVGLYAPVGTDPQTPHTRDEYYFVVSGTGEFVHDGQRTNFEPGDAIFVAAGVEHRFENFSEDFSTWVVFYGPEH